MTLRLVQEEDLAAFLTVAPFDGVELTTAGFLLELTESMVTEELEQVLVAVEDDEATIDTAGGSVVLLPELPVIGVSAVAYGDAYGNTPLDLVEGTDWHLEAGRLGRRGVLRRRSAQHWPSRGVVTVTYSHGYRTGLEDPALEAEDWPYELPGAIKAVILQAAARGFDNPTELRQAQAGRWGGTYAEVGLYLTHLDKTALDPFRKARG